MAEHRSVTAAREAYARGDQVLQIGLTIVGGDLPRKFGARASMVEDDYNTVLNLVAAQGWELVTGQLDRQPENAAILTMMYLWRRRR